MKKRILSIFLAALLLVSLLPTVALACGGVTPSSWSLLDRALTGEKQKSVDGVFTVSDEYGFRTVTLLKDIDAGANPVYIGEYVFLDLNHHSLTTTGKITNNGCITLHQENAGIVNYLLSNVPGNYATDEALKLPNSCNPDCIIPAGTFLTAEIGTKPAYLELGFASGDEALVWNRDVPAGMQLDVTYALTLGGDILSAKRHGVCPTTVTANRLALSDDITIGSNSPYAGEATLVVESIHDDFSGDEIGTIRTYGHSITLNRTGKLVVSLDVRFRDSALVSGVEDMVVCSEVDWQAGTVTYFLGEAWPEIPCYPIMGGTSLHGSVSADASFAFVGDSVILTAAPDKGFTLETLNVLDENGRAVALTNLGGNQFRFTMPFGAVTVSATFMEDNTMLNFCMDVKAYDNCYDSVLWAYRNGIASGVDFVRFAPLDTATRAQMVTFLWRAAGSPEPLSAACAFTDVAPTEYYYKAVLWAVEKGITKGTSATTFGPNETVSRGQAVTFLARMCGVSDTFGLASHPYLDVGAGDYCNNAVAWAYQNRITEGTSYYTFSPYDDCLRGEIVTFLYRVFAK